VEKSKQVKTVVMDMWDPYIASVHKFTGAEIVFDKFHVAKKVNEALDMVRKKEFKNATPEDRRDMKHKRFLSSSGGRRTFLMIREKPWQSSSLRTRR